MGCEPYFLLAGLQLADLSGDSQLQTLIVNFLLAGLHLFDRFGDRQFQALVIVGALACILLLASLFRLIARSAKKRKQRRFRGRPVRDSAGSAVSGMLFFTTLLVALIFGFCLFTYLGGADMVLPPAETIPGASVPAPASTPMTTGAPAETTAPPATTLPPETTQATEPTEAPTEPDPLLSFKPHHTENTDPANWNFVWEISVDGEITDSYTRETPISFGEPETYFTYPGVASFRGNNYRTDPAYGIADITEGSMEHIWTQSNGRLNNWPGCGWTGQPLIRKWDQATKEIMNLYDEKKEKEDLVEVIYATLDGYIYFFDLEDGSRTRDPVWIGMNMKGSGALDPRGYPLMYVGSGDFLNGSAPRMYVVSLIDGEILYQYGNNDRFAKRSWSGFDSGPLLSADTDTLIYPGENGVLYTIKLNTKYDQAAGTISVEPDTPVKARYSNDLTGRRYRGVESSCVMVGQYLFMVDNAGMFFCVDINTMELIWTQYVLDDTNASPVFEWGDDGNGYLYTAPALHWTANGSWGDVAVYKLDAQTGEIIWEHTANCGTVTDLAGGFQSSPVLGRKGTNLEGMIIYSLSRTPSIGDGLLIAMDTDTGETIWELDMASYGWSSPVGVYTAEGKGYVLMPCFTGTMYLLDGSNGEVLDTFDLGGHMEASPVVYENTVVIGTRSSRIFGLRLS